MITIKPALRLLFLMMLLFVGCKPPPPPVVNVSPPLEMPAAVTSFFAELRKCESMELVALSPNPKTEGPKLHGWTVLGSTAVEDPALRLKLINEVASAALPPGAIVMDCFEPRHALRIRTGDVHYDVIICFACNAVSVYSDDKPDWYLGFCITKAPSDHFNQTLSAAGL